MGRYGRARGGKVWVQVERYGRGGEVWVQVERYGRGGKVWVQVERYGMSREVYGRGGEGVGTSGKVW